MGGWEGREGGQVLTGIGQHRRYGRELSGEQGRDLVDLIGDFLAGGLGEDGADGRGHHLGRASWHPGEDVRQEVKP